VNILSLFSGIGGLELGLERAGLGVTRWQVEQDPFARQVLARHWPDAERFDDVREVSGEDFPGCDVICGGFPCQDVSTAGAGRGVENGQRSGLWREFRRLICEIRPRLVIVENVPVLTVRGLDRVLGDLAAARYDAEWEIVSAADAGANHRRERMFIVAHPNGESGRVHPRAAARPILQSRHRDRPPPAAFDRSADQPSLCMPDDGFSGWMGRAIRSYGNAVVPQVAQIVGQRARLILARGSVSDDAWDLSL